MNSSNRRGFFKVFGVLAAAASLSPTIFIPKFEPVKWKFLIPREAIPNPQWVRTDFEMFLIAQMPRFDEAILEGIYA